MSFYLTVELVGGQDLGRDLGGGIDKVSQSMKFMIMASTMEALSTYQLATYPPFLSHSQKKNIALFKPVVKIGPSLIVF